MKNKKNLEDGSCLPYYLYACFVLPSMISISQNDTVMSDNEKKNRTEQDKNVKKKNDDVMM